MKKLVFAIAAVALVVWIGSWFWNPRAVATSAAQAWPGGMGSLDSAATRAPRQNGNEAAAKLARMAETLRRSDAVDAFVAHEIRRPEVAIGKPPALPDVSATRTLLLTEQVVWAHQEGIGGGDETESRRKAALVIARALVADALANGRWDDLHAVWKLARSFDGHPQMMAQTAALTMARMVNAVAWKMPMPAPEWFAEVQERDAIRPLLESFHFQTASYAKDGSNLFPTVMLARSLDHDRRIAEQVLNESRCDVNIPTNEVGVDLSSVWRRAFWYRAERERTANALRIREGKSIETRSRCSDGGWTFDGATLRFSHTITTVAPDTPAPLTIDFPRRP